MSDVPENSMPAESEPEAVDLSGLIALEELSAPGEPDIVIELIDAYLTDASARCQQIKQAAVTSDRTLLKRAAHTLKGSSGSLGLDQIVALCEQLERADATDKIKALVQQMDAKFAGVCAALRKFRASRIS